MSSAAKTYVIANGNPNDGSQVEQNFLDLINFINGSVPHSDGTGGAADARGLVAGQVGDQGKKFHIGTTTQSFDSSGYATVTHGAGFTPTFVACVWSGQNLGGSSFGYIAGTDTYTATTFRCRNGGAISGSFLIRWYCVG